MLDIDYFLQYLTLSPSHRIFFHNLFVPLTFLILGFVFIKFKNKELGKHKLKLSTILFVISFGIFTHLSLDFLIQGNIYSLSPFITTGFGLNLIKKLPEFLQNDIIPIFDAVLLAFWMIWIELRHKLSDFI